MFFTCYGARFPILTEFYFFSLLNIMNTTILPENTVVKMLIYLYEKKKKNCKS